MVRSSYKITIPKPCAQSWDEMSNDGKGKFCLSCQKSVNDFTGFSDQQLIVWLKHNRESSCGKFSRSQLDRFLIKDNKNLATHSFPRLLVTTFLLFLGFPEVSNAQILDGKSLEMRNSSSSTKTDDEPLLFIKGSVRDKNGDVIAKVLVQLKNHQIITETNANGDFLIVLRPSKFDNLGELVFSSNNYQTKNHFIVLNGKDEVRIILEDVANDLKEAKLIPVSVEGKCYTIVGGLVLRTSVASKVIYRIKNLFR